MKKRTGHPMYDEEHVNTIWNKAQGLMINAIIFIRNLKKSPDKALLQNREEKSVRKPDPRARRMRAIHALFPSIGKMKFKIPVAGTVQPEWVIFPPDPCFGFRPVL
jgi:hypothetical protein